MKRTRLDPIPGLNDIYYLALDADGSLFSDRKVLAGKQWIDYIQAERMGFRGVTTCSRSEAVAMQDIAQRQLNGLKISPRLISDRDVFYLIQDNKPVAGVITPHPGIAERIWQGCKGSVIPIWCLDKNQFELIRYTPLRTI